jgi:hypothetical protein
MLKVVLDRTVAPDAVWFLAQDCIAHVHNISANHQINWKLPGQGEGRTPDISHIMMFHWFESVMYLDPVSKFPQSTKRPGYFVGFADNVDNTLIF